MTFVPKYHIAGAWPLVDNLLRIIARDQEEALTAVAGAGVLESFPRLDPAMRVINDPPFLAIQSVRSLPVVDDDEGSVDTQHELRLLIAIGGSDPVLLAKHLEWYKLAMTHILTTATEADMTEDLMTDNYHDKPVFEIGESVNGEIGFQNLRMKNQQYLRTAEIQFFVQIKEVRA